MSITEQIQQEIAALPPAQQQQVLDFVHAVRSEISDEEKAVGETVVKLLNDVIEPEDFSAWEKTGS